MHEPTDDKGGSMSFHPYLFFSGTCRDAFTRYQEVFGGELDLVTMADMPEIPDVPADQAHLIMHAALMADGQLLMGSDDPTGDGGPMKGVAVNCTVSDTGEAERIYAALADGGEATMPLAQTSWSPMFGMCTDRFGTPWMVNVEAPEGAG
jgi:PhnB protein